MRNYDDEDMERAGINLMLAAMAAAARVEDKFDTAVENMTAGNPIEVEATPQFKQD